MKTQDSTGNPIGRAIQPQALGDYDQALEGFHRYRGDPVATIDRALANEPEFAMGWILRGWLHALGTEPSATPVVHECLSRAERLKPNARESLHLQALDGFMTGRWEHASAQLGALSSQWPRDALALQAGHLIDFCRGDAQRLRNRIEVALPHWSPSDTSHSALLGMLAFGREECGDYCGAEESGRAALDACPDDAWAHHAVAHVHEMKGDARAGIAWMRQRQPHWAEDNFFAVHNWWHLAMFHLDLGETDEALAVFDDSIHGARSPLMLDLIDASALLWRLQLMGHPLGRRWDSVADTWKVGAQPGLYSFNDFHAMMAWVGAGRDTEAERWLAAQSDVDAGTAGDHARVSRDVGEPLLQALQCLHDDRAGDALAALRRVQPIAHRFGGSHAQRDLINLMLIDAAIRDGRTDLAGGLLRERCLVKPDSAINRMLQQRLPATATHEDQ